MDGAFGGGGRGLPFWDSHTHIRYSIESVYTSGILVRKERRTAVVRVHGNALKHGLTSEEVAYAWENPIRCRQRNGTDDPPLWISVGSLPDGRFAELIGFMDIDGVWCVFHAMVPPTKKFKRELGWR